MKKIMVILASFLILTPVFAGDFLAKKQVKLGKEVSDFTLQDLQGQSVSLSSFRGKPVMIHFWSAKCPFVVRYEERLKAITRDYAGKVTVLGINPNVNDTLEETIQVSGKRGVNYPILMDPGNKIADQFGAVTTPHIFIIDAQGKLVYEGAVDNQGWNEGKTPDKHYVRDALDALLAGKKIEKNKTRTAGCTVKRKE